MRILANCFSINALNNFITIAEKEPTKPNLVSGSQLLLRCVFRSLLNDKYCKKGKPLQKVTPGDRMQEMLRANKALRDERKALVNIVSVIVFNEPVYTANS